MAGSEIYSSNVDCSQAILSNMSSLRTNSANTDVTLKIGSKSFKLHKLILSAASPVFDRMFQGDWKESKVKAVDLHEDLPECEAVFETFLDFIYGENSGVVSIDQNNVLPLITLANKYGVDGLTKNCTLFLLTMIEGSIDQAFKWLSIAEEKHLSSVVKRCFDTLCFNLKIAASNIAWTKMTYDQLACILKREDVWVGTEYEVYEAAQKWLSAERNSRLDKEDDIVSFIEFRNMTKAEIDKVKKSQLYTRVLSKLPQIANSVESAVKLRALEGAFAPGVSTRRCYWNTPGSMFYNQLIKAKAVESLNTDLSIFELKVSASQPVMGSCSFYFQCSREGEKKIFKISKSASGNTGLYAFSTGIRRVDAVVFVVGKKGIIHHFLLQTSALSSRNSDVLIEFDPIPCANCKQPSVAKILYKINCE